jgi:hypothetical protein
LGHLPFAGQILALATIKANGALLYIEKPAGKATLISFRGDQNLAVPKSAGRYFRRAIPALKRHLPASAEAVWDVLQSRT